MKRLIKIVAAIIIVCGIAASGFFLYKTSTPEYALLKTIQDINRQGCDGLKVHLSEKALEKVNSIESFSGQTGLTDLIGKLTKDNAAGFLKDKMSDITWTVEDVLKGKDQASAIIRFSYNKKISGTIQVIMLKDGATWKIDALASPKLTNISLW